MATTKKAPARGRGRPRRADGLDPNSREARRLRGSEVVTVSLPAGTIELVDACATAWQCSRPTVIMRALSIAIAADDGIVALDLRPGAR